MVEHLYSTAECLDPMIREYRVSFLTAIQTFAPSVLRDLESVFLQRLSGSALKSALHKWAQDHCLYFWVIAIARHTMERWERNPTMSRTTWKLPRVQAAAVWDDAPFSFNHRGYNPHIDGSDIRVYNAKVRKEFELGLASNMGRVQGAKDQQVSGTKQSGPPSPIIQKRSRDGRDKHVAFEWLAMSIEPGINLRIIATKAKVDRAAVVKQINWAKSVLSVE
jgi:hypothetical protein